MIDSYIDRIHFDEYLIQQMLAEWSKYKDYIRAQNVNTVLKRDISEFITTNN